MLVQARSNLTEWKKGTVFSGAVQGLELFIDGLATCSFCCHSGESRKPERIGRITGFWVR
jgi:hypothetical protein